MAAAADARYTQDLVPALVEAAAPTRLPDQIAPFVPGEWTSLGTDGFGYSDTRAALRRHFGIDAPSIALRVIEQLIARDELDGSVRDAVMEAHHLDPAPAAQS